MDSEWFPWPIGFQDLGQTMFKHLRIFCLIGWPTAYQNLSESDFFCIDKENLQYCFWLIIKKSHTFQFTIHSFFRPDILSNYQKHLFAEQTSSWCPIATTYNLSLVIRLTLNLFSFGSLSEFDWPALRSTIAKNCQIFFKKCHFNISISTLKNS